MFSSEGLREHAVSAFRREERREDRTCSKAVQNIEIKIRNGTLEGTRHTPGL